MKNYLAKVNRILSEEPDRAFARRAQIIFENLKLSGKEKILEVGCGRGFYLKTLKTLWPDLEVTGIDLNQKYLDQAKKFLGNLEVQLVCADATKLPFKDNSFDRIIATEVLEHISDDQKAIAEMYRVLKPGGIAIVTVPNTNYPFLWDPLNWTLERLFHRHIPSNIWWLAGIWADHVRLYSEKKLVNEIKKVGFRVEKFWRATFWCFPFSHFLLYGIGKNLVEKGFLQSCSRFGKKKNIFLNQLILFPFKTVDKLNDFFPNFSKTSVNLIFKIFK